jgi:hypothetical protein
MTSLSVAAADTRRRRVAPALRRAAADFYRQSWRLAILNTIFCAGAIAVAFAAAGWLPAIALVVLLGPLAAALVHSCVVLVETEELRLLDAVEGLRLHWRRGLALGAVTAIVGAAGAVSIVVYAHAHTFVWPLAFLVAYLLLLLAVLQLVLWPLAIAHPGQPLGLCARDAVLFALRRPWAVLRLAVALALVNLVGAALAVLPLLTLTISYTFLAATHFVLPRPEEEAAA